MEMNVWKKCVCICGMSLLMITTLYASQVTSNVTPDEPVKKTRSTTFIYEKDKIHGNLLVKVLPGKLWVMTAK